MLKRKVINSGRMNVQNKTVAEVGVSMENIIPKIFLKNSIPMLSEITNMTYVRLPLVKELSNSFKNMYKE